MKKLLIMLIGGIVFTAGATWADCMLVPDHINTDGVQQFKLAQVQSNSTGEEDDSLGVLVNTGSCTENSPVVSLSNQSIAYIDTIEKFFADNGYVDNYKKLIFTYQAESDLMTLIESHYPGTGDATLGIYGYVDIMMNDSWGIKAYSLMTALRAYKNSLVEQVQAYSYTLPDNGYAIPDNSYTDDSTYIDDNSGNEDLTDTGPVFSDNDEPTIQDGTQDLTTNMKNSQYIVGNTSGTLMVVEYSDIGCNHCVSHFQSGTITQLMNTYPGDMSFVWKPVDIGFNASYHEKAVICAGMMSGSASYNSMYQQIMTNTTFTWETFQSNLLSEAQVDAYATGMSLNLDEFHSCVNSNAADVVLSTNQLEGTDYFNLDGTPYSVILNTKTNQWSAISGSYPLDVYVKAAANLLK